MQRQRREEQQCYNSDYSRTASRAGLAPLLCDVVKICVVVVVVR
jgi:hypothetical protein